MSFINILVINAGSSSLKYQLINVVTHEVAAKGICERIGIDGKLKHSAANGNKIEILKKMDDHKSAISVVLSALLNKEHGVISSTDEISAVGHRVVHGGEKFSRSVVITSEVKQAIKDCFELAPLHNPANYVGICACEEAMPGVPMVAVFDTAFHQTMPREAYMYALPYEYYEKYKIRKYGFHGTSHKYVASRAAKMLGRPLEELKIITLHLGNGASVAAIKNGVSIDTTMGMTPLAGVIMGTRCGLIDPAIIKFLMEKENLTISEVDDIMNKKSGMLGISGISSDFRDVEDAADLDNARAKLALDMFEYSAKQYIGTYAAIMGGVDAIVFTAGVGENNSAIRKHMVEDLAFMGIKIDRMKNKIRSIEADVSADDATVRTLVVPTNEELMIALDTEELLGK